jgi:hypothetical protein
VPVASNNSELLKKTLIGTIGYHNLQNHSVGPVITPRLEEIEWPAKIRVEELNWGPIAIVQKFQALSESYKRVVMICALQRPGRDIGEITCFRWQSALPSEEQIQAGIGDAVTGVVSLENLLVIGEYFDIWPDELFIIDMEPGPEESGPNLTPQMEAKVPELLETVKHFCLKNEPEIATLNYSFTDITELTS